MLEQAIETIDQAVERLRPAIEDDSVRGIVVCEPSCLSAIKDDWLKLKCSSSLELRRRLAAKAMLAEEFVEREWERHPIRPRVTMPAGVSQVLLHGHCHQKALWGVESSARLLRRLAGDKLRVLDTGCCGMAGSFGFGVRKFELSMAIGELALLPMVRQAPADAVIVAPGTSCRHQIHDGAARRAMHPMEFAESVLAGN